MMKKLLIFFILIACLFICPQMTESDCIKIKLKEYDNKLDPNSSYNDFKYGLGKLFINTVPIRAYIDDDS